MTVFLPKHPIRKQIFKEKYHVQDLFSIDNVGANRTKSAPGKSYTEEPNWLPDREPTWEWKPKMIDGILQSCIPFISLHLPTHCRQTAATQLEYEPFPSIDIVIIYFFDSECHLHYSFRSLDFFPSRFGFFLLGGAWRSVWPPRLVGQSAAAVKSKLPLREKVSNFSSPTSASVSRKLYKCEFKRLGCIGCETGWKLIDVFPRRAFVDLLVEKLVAEVAEKKLYSKKSSSWG